MFGGISRGLSKQKNEELKRLRILMTVQYPILSRIPVIALALTAACTQDHVMDELTSTPISAAAGGIAKSHDGLVELEFPAGALSADADIQIRTKSGLSDGRVVTASYEFSPDGLTFQKPVEIRLQASGETRELEIANLDGADPVPLETSSHDRNSGIITATLEHFSAYGGVVRYDPCRALVCGDTCLICNPANPNCMTPPGARVCSAAGRCLPQAAVSCQPTPDAGTIPDAGNPPRPDAGTVPDAGPPPTDGGVTPGVIQESEPNNSIATANAVQSALGGTATVQGAIMPVGDEDYFMFFVPGGASATVNGVTYSQLGDTSVCARIDTVLTLFDDSGVQIAQNDDRSSGNSCSEINVTLTGGRYFFRVTHFTSQTIPNYFLDITVTVGTGTPDAGTNPPADAGTAPTDGGTTVGVLQEVEPNNIFDEAQLINNGTAPIPTISGAASPVGDIDIFMVHPIGASTLRAYTYSQLGNPSVCNRIDTYLTVYDANFVQIGANDDANGTSCSDVSVPLGPLGNYYVEVRHFNNATGLIPQYYLDILIQ